MFKIQNHKLWLFRIYAEQLKFHCENCRLGNNFTLTHELLDSKDSIIKTKDDLIVSLQEHIKFLKKELEQLTPNNTSTDSRSYAQVAKQPLEAQVPAIKIVPRTKQEISKTKNDFASQMSF